MVGIASIDNTNNRKPSLASVSVAEGGAATYHLTLTSNPSSEVTVNITSSLPSVTVSTPTGSIDTADGIFKVPFSMTSSSGNTEITITVMSAADSVAVDTDVILTYTALQPGVGMGMGYNGVTGTLPVMVINQ